MSADREDKGKAKAGLDRRDFMKLGALAGAAAAVPAVASAAPKNNCSKTFAAWTDEPYIHWSAHVSLYSAKTRAYMIKKGLNFIETTPYGGYAGVSGKKNRWYTVIEPAMGYFGIPVLDLPDGTFISDTTAIIRYLEEKHPEPSLQPANPVMKALAWLIFNYGTEGLFLECQHYRWSFKESADFAGADIGRGLGGPDNVKAIESYGTGFGDMKKKRFPEKVGITKETIPAIEKSAMLVFAKLDKHFREQPYILGGRPSIADAALMEVLHAHLGRDPYAATIMKQTAPTLFRWTETMNWPGIPTAELSQVPQEYSDIKKLPPTLIDFLKLMCADFGPQFQAVALAYENWLGDAPDRPEGTAISNDKVPKNRQAMGRMEYLKQGVTVKRDAWPDVMNMHQYVLEVVDTMTPAEKGQWADLMKTIGGEVFLETPVPRPIVIQKHKKPYQYVLGPKSA
jgi:glutathione S-transferase